MDNQLHMNTTPTNTESFQHVVFAAMSKQTFYLREFIIKHILEQGYTPTCAFMMFSYYLLDSVDRDSLIAANNGLIRKSDELWVYGPISSGVGQEINLAQQLGLPIKYFYFADQVFDFTEISADEAEHE